jgi:hypothetical protein
VLQQAIFTLVPPSTRVMSVGPAHLDPISHPDPLAAEDAQTHAAQLVLQRLLSQVDRAMGRLDGSLKRCHISVCSC